jgi:hypothetical protein
VPAALFARRQVLRFVFTPGRINAGIGQGEFRNWLSSNDMRVNDLVDLFPGDPAVPCCLWVHHDHRAMFALLQTSRLLARTLVPGI